MFYPSWSCKFPDLPRVSPRKSAVQSRHFQHEFSINVWLLIYNTQFLVRDPFFLPEQVIRQTFFNKFVQEHAKICEEINLNVRRTSWFQLDGQIRYPFSRPMDRCSFIALAFTESDNCELIFYFVGIDDRKNTCDYLLCEEGLFNIGCLELRSHHLVHKKRFIQLRCGFVRWTKMFAFWTITLI